VGVLVYRQEALQQVATVGVVEGLRSGPDSSSTHSPVSGLYPHPVSYLQQPALASCLQQPALVAAGAGAGASSLAADAAEGSTAPGGVEVVDQQLAAPDGVGVVDQQLAAPDGVGVVDQQLAALAAPDDVEVEGQLRAALVGLQEGRADVE